MPPSWPESRSNPRIAELPPRLSTVALTVLEHGITDEEVAEAPPWAQVLPELLAVTAGRSILAYNASFDEGVVARHSVRDGLDLGHLAEDGRWACLMDRRTDWALRRRWLPLSGGHRASTTARPPTSCCAQ
jgi:hypothetical protein